MSFFVYPSGPQSHTRELEARDSSVSNAPYIQEEDLSICWRLNGVEVKTGNIIRKDDRKINTGDLADYNFDAADTGLVVDFVIGGTDYATGVTLTNNLPTIDSAGFDHLFFNLMPRKDAVFSWDFTDQDGDPQYAFRLKVGSADGLSDYYDSGIVYGPPGDANGDGVVDNDDIAYVKARINKTRGEDGYDVNADFNRDGVVDENDLDIVKLFLGSRFPSGMTGTYAFTLPVELPSTSLAFWSLTVSDGEKAVPTAADWPEPSRKFVEAKGMNAVNSPPVISNVLVDGA